MADLKPVAKQNPFLEVPAKLGAPFVPFVKEVQTVKNLAQSFLSGIWFLQGIPRLVKMIPANVEHVLPFLEWTKSLKPWEVFFSTLKDVGNLLDLPEKIVNLRNVKAEWVNDPKNPDKQNRWKAVYRITSVVYVAIDAIVLIPQKWNLWNLLAIGNWAARIGVTTFGVAAVKDGLTALSSAINVKAEGLIRRKAIAEIEKCQKRIDPNGPLAQLKKMLSENAMHNEAYFKKIDDLKEEHKKTQFGSQAKIDKTQKSDELKLAIDKDEKKREEICHQLDDIRKNTPQATKKIAEKEQELLKIDQNIATNKERVERKKLWSEKATPAELDRLGKVVVYKAGKNDVRIANANMLKEKSTIIRWFEVSKCAVIIFTYLLTLGVATVLAPHIGLSAAAIGSIFFLGQWITGISTGICGFGRTMAMHRFKTSFALPQTHLLRA